jgi:hypothetical protein
MFLARRLRDGSTLYLSRATNRRYIIAEVLPRWNAFRLYVDGRQTGNAMPRREALARVELMEGLAP